MDDILPVTSKVFNFGAWWRNSGNFFILGGALLLVIGVVFFWAVAIRKREDRYTSHRERLRHHRSSSGEKSKPAPSAQHSHKRKHRKRRSSHPRYPKNPTLDETGGLPPIREHPPSSPPVWPKD